jgi:hypothetical protein
VDPVPDPLLLRKSGSARNRTRDPRVSSQKLWLLDHRGGPYQCQIHYYKLSHHWFCSKQIRKQTRTVHIARNWAFVCQIPSNCKFDVWCPWNVRNALSWHQKKSASCFYSGKLTSNLTRLMRTVRLRASSVGMFCTKRRVLDRANKHEVNSHIVTYT